MSRTVKILATAVTAAITLAACGGDGGGGAEPPPTPSASAPATGPTASPTAATYKRLDKAALTQALLPLKSMPAGYSEAPDEEDDGKDKTFCNYRQPHTAKVEVSRSYQKGGGLNTEVAMVTLRQFGSADQAKASFDKLAEVLQTCRKDTLNGQQVTYALMNLPETGEASLGVRIEMDNGTVLQGFALVGPVLISTGAGGLMSADADVVADLLGKQVDRYSAAALA
ncbi:hypothetical protein AB0I85_15170 [Micromonospora echinofusca]|uniref:hypothetical protein n=1 Tax=Micromonospora echinofusca TaxID=47858 RepID=UPI00340ABB0C